MTEVHAMIPARKGSQRLPYKNLALIDGKPMISYVIEAAKNADVFDKISINSDSAVFEDIAAEYDVGFYHRPAELGSSETKSDDVVNDFIQSHSCDVVAWVNPIAPLQRSGEMNDIVTYFLDNNLDSLITVKKEQVHCVCDDEPVNFSYGGKFEKTQSLKPVSPFVYSIMMWDVDAFTKAYDSTESALFCGETDYYPVGDESSLIVKYKSDLKLIEAIVKGRNELDADVAYHELVDDIE